MALLVVILIGGDPCVVVLTKMLTLLVVILLHLAILTKNSVAILVVISKCGRFDQKSCGHFGFGHFCSCSMSIVQQVKEHLGFFFAVLIVKQSRFN